MDVVKQCKDAWSSATSDTERFAAMLVIVNLAKSTDLSGSQRKEIFDRIGFSFISRLLQTEEVPEGCSPMIYKSLAFSVLSCFCSDQVIAGSDEMCSFISECKHILDANLCSASEKSLIVDILYCISSMSTYEKGRQYILENDIVTSLVNLYILDTCGKSRSLEILQTVTFYLKSETWKNNSAFNDLFVKMSKEFSDDSSNVELCRNIISILLDHPLCQVQGDEEWALEIQVSLTKVLRCKVTKEVRDLAIKLASIMVEKCGTSWFGDETDNSKVFFIVLIQIVCVEVQLVLDETRALEDILADTSVLSACFSILESVIAVMVNENLWHPLHHFSVELITSIRAAYKAIISCLLKVSCVWESMGDATEYSVIELTSACVRALCAWLAEETGVLQDEVREILPFLLTVCNEFFVELEFKDPECTRCDDIESSRFDLTQFFIAPLCHLTADDISRAILLEHRLPNLLFQYMYYKWSIYEENPSSEIEILLCTVCGVILNIVVLEVRAVSESEEFFRFLMFLCDTVSLLPTDFENLRLKANFSALGLLITKQCYKRIRSCETSFYRFLSFSVKFLWDTHHIEDGNNSSVFVLVREYYHVWPDISELWFLGMQALLTLLPVMPWIASFLMESGWPQHIITSFAKVEEHSIEESVKYAYQAFLSALVRVNKDVIPTLNACEAIVVCRKHKLRELETLLLQ